MPDMDGASWLVSTRKEGTSWYSGMQIAIFSLILASHEYFLLMAICSFSQ